ncbi:uncharacterized protein [Musca autumnalis]|uniref:uncharacterized protein n=1 Tax=Musca autumnalis TaxID=221902 RepID=UPI003CFAC551
MANANGYHYESCRNSTVIAHRLSIYVPNIFLPTKNPQKLVMDLNLHLATFRDMLINVGQSKDNPELRERIRKYRHICLEESKHASEVMIDLAKSSAEVSDTSHATLLFQLLQLFLNELFKCYRLIQIIPMDMSKLYEHRSRPTNIGNVLGQLLLCKQIAPDFNQEELNSIMNAIKDIKTLQKELQKYITQDEFQINGESLDPHKSLQYLIRNDRRPSKRNCLLCCASSQKYV